MVQSTLTFGQPVAVPAVDNTELRVRYGSYRLRQATRLLQLLPREAIRPLYRRARMAALESGASPEEVSDDPMALLVRYCEQLLPLPPFEIWYEDLRQNPDAHLADLDESADGPTADAPSTMATQGLTFAGHEWLARLRAFRDGGFWRGYITFEQADQARVHRTTAVFCERDPADLRKRFLSFEPAALEAFLRSALP
jgi:hypothetical protein